MTTGETTKGGNVILRNVRIPDTVEPGETFAAKADVDNGAAFINLLDPDQCNPGTLNTGYNLSVKFEGPDGTVKEDGPACHGVTENGSQREEYSKDFTAPMDADQATVKAWVVMRDSGKTTDAMSDTAEVSTEDPTQPEDPDDSYGDGPIGWNDGDGNNDDSDQNGPSLPDFGLGDKLEGVGLLVVVALGVYLLVELGDSGAEVASPL